MVSSIGEPSLSRYNRSVMDLDELKEKIRLREKEIQLLDDSLLQAERANDEKKVQRLNDQKLAARQELNTLMTKLPVVSRTIYEYEDSLRKVAIDIGVKGATNAFTTVLFGVVNIVVLGLVVRYYRNSIKTVANSIFEVPGRAYENVKNQSERVWQAYSPMNVVSRFRPAPKVNDTVGPSKAAASDLSASGVSEKIQRTLRENVKIPAAITAPFSSSPEKKEPEERQLAVVDASAGSGQGSSVAAEVAEGVAEGVRKASDLLREAQETVGKVGEQVRSSLPGKESLPSMPSMPSMPSLPSMPTMPTMPSMPSIPGQKAVRGAWQKVQESSQPAVGRIGDLVKSALPPLPPLPSLPSLQGVLSRGRARDSDEKSAPAEENRISSPIDEIGQTKKDQGQGQALEKDGQKEQLPEGSGWLGRVNPFGKGKESK